MMKKMKSKTRRNLIGLGFTAPWIIGFLIFTLFPILYSFYLSLNKVTIGAQGIMTEFIGFKNYQAAFSTSMEGLEAILSFLKNSLFMVFIINVFSVLFAVLLNCKIKGRGFFRTLFFLPVVIVSGPVMAELVNNEVITMPNLGDLSIIRIIGETFGMKVSMLITNAFSQLIYMFWFSGVQLIVYLSMLQKMDKSMYEAAQMDGASPWESFWKITLPALKPIILINLVYTFILLASFDNNEVIKVIKDTMFSIVNGKGYGLSAAFSWIYFFVLAFIVIIIFLLFYLRREKKITVNFNRDRLGLPLTRYEKAPTKFNTNKKVKKVKKFFFGKNLSDGFLVKFFIYLLLIVVSFAFLYPFIDMLLMSLQSPEDVLNPMIGNLPSSLYLENYKKAFKVLGFFKACGESVYYAIIPTICQVICAAFVGYGLARFDFIGKKAMLVLIVITFILPASVTMIPTYVMYSEIGFLGSVLTFAIPALFGQGLKSAIFILIFYQSFRMIPKELDEACYIDGANSLQVFFKIAIPLSIPILIVGFIFSFVWYWNETYLTSLYIPDAHTLPMQLSSFAESFRNIYGGGSGGNPVTDSINEAIYMAGTLISILPLLLLYFVLQHWFVEGIDRAGLTGQ